MSVLMDGMMIKRSQGKNKLLNKMQGFKFQERWFELTNESLSYYQGREARPELLRGKVLVANISNVESIAEEVFNKKNVLGIKHTACTLYTIATSEYERQSWIHAIRDSCKLNGRFHGSDDIIERTRMLSTVGNRSPPQYPLLPPNRRSSKGSPDSNNASLDDRDIECSEIHRRSMSSMTPLCSNVISVSVQKPLAVPRHSALLPRSPKLVVAASSASIPVPSPRSHVSLRSTSLSKSQDECRSRPGNVLVKSSNSIPRSSENRSLQQRIDCGNIDEEEDDEEESFRVQALFDFTSRVIGELSFYKDDILIVFNTEDSDWWQARAEATDEIGYIPSNHVAEVTSIECEPWYHGKINREEATSLLRACGQSGQFIIRESQSKAGDYSLTLRNGEHIRHYRIRTNELSCQVHITERISFNSIRDLVKHYICASDGLPCRLTTPLPRGGTPITMGLSHDKDIWEIERSELNMGSEIGSGQFGVVCKGTWRGVTPVAIKVMKEGAMLMDDFLAEASVMKKFQHPNLVKLLAVISKEEPLCIVTELMSQGCLLDCLRNHKQDPFNYEVLVYMAMQIANGMAYLEAHSFIHRDLAARNCLVGENNIVKVADFGLSRLVDEGFYHAHEGTKFPVKWTALEIVTHAKFSNKSDVWSFGILLWEMWTFGGVPYGSWTNIEVLQQVTKGYRLEQPTGCSDEIYSLMLETWDIDPDTRADFSVVYDRICRIGESI